MLALPFSLMLQAQDYTWKKGSNTVDQAGTYGTYGIPALANTPGGRTNAACWKDASGNFWLFGGLGIDVNGTTANLSDLWKYNPATNIWAFMKGDSIGDQPGDYGTIGVAAASNMPGGRNVSASWTDANGNFWMFGGNGIDGNGQPGDLNDLWVYKPATNQWTWMNGSTTANATGVYGTMGTAAAGNHPGSREGINSWADAAGNLWLFGGYGHAAVAGIGALNDLWKYTIATNQWTWVKGGNTVNQHGIYGTKGIAAAANIPGARNFSNVWTDAAGNFWMQGGLGYIATGNSFGLLDDLWKYNSVTNQWTWVNGSNNMNQFGVYGTQGVAAASNAPGGRGVGATWADALGNLWLMGGSGYVTASGNPTSGSLNDLWKYNISANNWTWVKGANTALPAGVYGVQGTASSLNTPGGRNGIATWTDNTGGLWLFGGWGFASSGQPGELYLNDLWKFQSCATQTLAIQSPSAICAGASATLTSSGASTYSWSTQQSSSSVTVSPAVSTLYTVQSADAGSCKNSASVTLSVNPLPLVSAASSRSAACEGEQVSIIATGATAYAWSSGQTGSSIQVVAGNTLYTVTGTDANGCSKSASVMQSVAICTGLKENSSVAGILVYPNPTSGMLSISSAAGARLSAALYNTLGARLAAFANENKGMLEIDLNTQGLQNGIYFITVNDNGVLSTHKIIYTK